MTDYRKRDTERYTKFRAGRFFKEGGQWYFSTREGTTEGPFELRQEAETKLETYIRVMTSGFLPEKSELSIEPLSLQLPD